MSEQAIHQQAAINPYRLKHPRIRATGPHWIHQFTLGEDGRLAGNNVSRRDGEGNAQLLERFAAQNFAQESSHLVIAEKSEAGESPAGEIFEADNRSHLFQFLAADA